MSSELRTQLNNIVEEKNTKVIPENIRAGVTIFDVEGTLVETDFSDITATASDVLQGVSAYGKDGEKIEGTYIPIDTSDATAVAEDILAGKSAYVNGEKIEGTIPVVEQYIVPTPKENETQIVEMNSYINSMELPSLIDFAITNDYPVLSNYSISGTRGTSANTDSLSGSVTSKIGGRVIAAVMTRNTEVETPSGWTLLGKIDVKQSETDTGYQTISVFHKIATSEKTSINVSQTAKNQFFITMMSFEESGDIEMFFSEGHTQEGSTIINEKLYKGDMIFTSFIYASIGALSGIDAVKYSGTGSLSDSWRLESYICNENLDAGIAKLSFSQGTSSAQSFNVCGVRFKKKIRSEIIKTGETVLGIEGTYSGLDTSDATAIVSDIAGGKTAYVNGQKITGDLTEYTSSNGGFVNQTIDSSQARASLNSGNLQVQANASQNFLARKGAMISVFASSDIIAKAIGLTADKIAEGSTILDIVGTHNGLDTSDATATSKDIVEGKTAYADGQLVTGVVPSYDSTKPVELRGTYEVIDSTAPYFILTKQTPKGEVFNEILKFPSSAIDKAWIEDKSFALRVYYFSSTDYRIQLEVAPKGCKFQYSASWTGTNNYDMGVVAYDSNNKLTPFTIYSCTTNDLNKLTTSSWNKEEKTDTSTYSNKYGGVNYIFAYSSDASIKNGSHNSTNGIPAMGDKIVIKDTVNSLTNGAHISNNTEIYTKIPQSDIATHIGLTSDMIAKGQSVLGVSGSLEVLDTSDADATAADIIKDKTAYVNGQKITGTAILGVDISDATISEGDVAEGKLAYSSAGRITGTLPNITDTLEYSNINVIDDATNSQIDLTITNETDRIVRQNAKIHSAIGYSSLANTIGLTPEKLVRGNTVLGIEGTQALGYDTSDATAVAGDIVSGKTAYINGGIVTGTLTAVTGNLTVSESDVTLSDNGTGKYLGLKHQLSEKAIYDAGSTLNYQVGYSRLAQLFNITGDKIVKGNTVLGVEGTALTGEHYPQLYTSVEAMNADTTRPDGTFAIVYGTTYDGTFICSSGVWEQIGQPTETVETYNSLSLVDESEATYYEGMGGTEEEIVTVLDEVLGNEEEV